MIYIQADSNRTRPHHFDCATAMYGAIDTGQDYRLTPYEEIESGKYDMVLRSNLAVGSVEFMNLVFNRLGLSEIRVPLNSNRTHQVSTLGEIRKLAKSGNKYFIKPFDIKLFTGFVIDQMEYTHIKSIPDDTPVMVYEPFNHQIESEWRCYILHNRVEYIANYSGDFLVSVDGSYLQKVIEENKSTFPVAYTIDIGVLSNGENVVVEFNDMWAIGNYGLPNNLYLRMLSERYFEIIRMRSDI